MRRVAKKIKDQEPIDEDEIDGIRLTEKERKRENLCSCELRETQQTDRQQTDRDKDKKKNYYYAHFNREPI